MWKLDLGSSVQFFPILEGVLFTHITTQLDMIDHAQSASEIRSLQSVQSAAKYSRILLSVPKYSTGSRLLLELFKMLQSSPQGSKLLQSALNIQLDIVTFWIHVRVRSAKTVWSRQGHVGGPIHGSILTFRHLDLKA